MKFPKKTIFSSRHAWHMFTLTLLVAIMAVGVSAQRSMSGSKVEDKIMLAGGDLDQCQNGKAPTPPQPCAWVNGNLNVNNSQWQEGQSVPYRLTFAGLDPNTNYTIVLGYDTTEGGIHTLDYLTTWTRNAPAGTNVCAGASLSCVPTALNGTAPIPLDPRVQAGFDQIPGNSDDIYPGPDGESGTADDAILQTGVFTFFNGGYFTAVPTVNDFTYNGTYAGNSQAFITLSFNTGPNPNEIVLAWSGHIASRFDWGFGNAAVQLTGSSYHMRTAGGTAGSGNQDRSMKIDAVVFPGLIIIRKEVSALANTIRTSPLPFGFGFGSDVFPAFQLIDNRDELDPLTPVPTLNEMCGPGGTTPADVTDYQCFEVDNEALFETNITVTETGSPLPWSLDSLVCTIANGGNNVIGTVSPSAPVNQPTATIFLREANIAYCTYRNTATATTAAPASISGRVSASDGTGIYGARMVLTNASTGETFYAMTNPFGYYTFDGMPVSDFYIIGVGHKRYSFAENQRTFTLDQDLTGVDFIAN
jgi:hypothetical protein